MIVRSSMFYGLIVSRSKKLQGKSYLNWYTGQRYFTYSFEDFSVSITVALCDKSRSIPARVIQLVYLDENRQRAFDCLVNHQEKVQATFDKKAHWRVMKKRELVLMWDKMREKPRKHGKFDSIWLGLTKLKTSIDQFFSTSMTWMEKSCSHL